MVKVAVQIQLSCRAHISLYGTAFRFTSRYLLNEKTSCGSTAIIGRFSMVRETANNERRK